MGEKQMNAWIYNGLTRSLKLKKIETPKPNQGELLIKVKACGICGSDLHLFRKDFEKITSIRLLARSFIDSLIKPSMGERILGHEISGMVVDSKDEKFDIGDRVAVFPKTSMGNFGETLPGCFAEYMVIPSYVALKIPEHISYEEAALFEPLGSVLHAVKKLNRIVLEKGPERALIIGAGTIGLLTLQILKYMKLVDEVYVSDKIPFKLEIAKKLGADHVLTPPELPRKYSNFFDIVFEAVGGFSIESTINQAIEALKEKGVIILMGAVEISPKIKLGILHTKEGVLIGSFSLTYHDYVEAFNLVNSRKINVAQLVTHRFPLIEAPKAINIALSGKSIKTILIGD
jgi:2-desacetyl-2-hydroxyethyl bacteriochlorophyllide A dehydrogenase